MLEWMSHVLVGPAEGQAFRVLGCTEVARCVSGGWTCDGVDLGSGTSEKWEERNEQGEGLGRALGTLSPEKGS